MAEARIRPAHLRGACQIATLIAMAPRSGRPPKTRPQELQTPTGGRSIGDRLRQARQRAQAPGGEAYSLRDLAAASGVSAQAIQALEAGRSEARLGTVERLARALGVRPEWLAGWVG